MALHNKILMVNTVRPGTRLDPAVQAGLMGTYNA